MGRASGRRMKRAEYHRSAAARSLTVDWASTRWMVTLWRLVLPARLIAVVGHGDGLRYQHLTAAEHRDVAGRSRA